MKTVLLVDDSRVVRIAVSNIIEPMGFQILEAGDGQEALEILRDNPQIDIVLLDWNMPIMDGYEFLTTLRADKEIPQPLVMMCTTENEMSQIVKAMQAGADEYIMKPFTEEILCEKFSEVGLISS
ncbi:MAG: response regulator [Planctomycetes bacterium]|nr:response regulator [Planctomycetota bacterium]